MAQHSIGCVRFAKSIITSCVFGVDTGMLSLYQGDELERGKGNKMNRINEVADGYRKSGHSVFKISDSRLIVLDRPTGTGYCVRRDGSVVSQTELASYLDGLGINCTCGRRATMIVSERVPGLEDVRARYICLECLGSLVDWIQRWRAALPMSAL